MRKQLLAIALMLLAMRPASALQKPKVEPSKETVLTDEEKEILQNRDILENLDLLQNFEKLQLIDLFADEKKPEKGQSKKQAATKDGKKQK